MKNGKSKLMTKAPVMNGKKSVAKATSKKTTTKNSVMKKGGMKKGY